MTTNADFKGNYAPIVYNTENKSVLFLASDGTFRYPGGGKTTINAFRGYFELKDIEAGSPAGAPGLRIISNLNEEATTTSVENLGEDNKAVKVLENGVLYILCDGVRYDVMGKKVSNR